MDRSKFKDRRVHFRNSGVEGLWSFVMFLEISVLFHVITVCATVLNGMIDFFDQ